MIKFFKRLFQYKLEMALVIMLFSNLYTFWLPKPLYYLLWAVSLYYINKSHSKSVSGRSSLAVALIAVIVFSSLINLALDIRFVLISVVLFVTLARTSYGYYQYKVNFIYAALFGFAVTGVINYIAYELNINYFTEVEGMHFGEELYKNFSGFTTNPMWLSAASGVGTIFAFYWANKFYNRGEFLYAVLVLPVIYMCILTTTRGASRSALGVSLFASLVLLFLNNKKPAKIIGIATVVCVGSFFLMPKIEANSQRIREKQMAQESRGQISRAGLWSQRIEEFKSSPVWGIGYAKFGVGEYSHVGTGESGNGYLSMLAQTGLVGLVLGLSIIKRGVLPLKKIRGNDKVALFFCVALYMAMHTNFEGYIFQAGWYLCFFFWMLISTLDDYRRYNRMEVCPLARVRLRSRRRLTRK